MIKLNIFFKEIIFLIYLNGFIFALNPIVIPLKYLCLNDSLKLEPNTLINHYLKNNIYTSIEIGTPPLNITLFLDDSHSGFVLKESNIFLESDYSVSKSTTFKYDEGLNYQYINYELKTTLNNTMDKLYLYKANTENLNLKTKNNFFHEKLTRIEIEEFKFLYLPNKDEIKQMHKFINKKETKINDNGKLISYSPKFGYIGLLSQSINTDLTFTKTNFIQQLKNKNIIDNYYWYINYNKDNAGELIIGAAPHEINPEKYSEDDLYMIHAKLNDDNFLWEIYFSSIDLLDYNSSKKYNMGNTKAIISLNDNFIQSSKEFFNNITSIFFQRYIDNYKCKNVNINKDNSKYSVIYCYQKNFTENDINKFPRIALQSNEFNELNYVFNLDYKDLFLKTENIYIFKIIYNWNNNCWKLGKIFLEKYQFLFDYDKKMFGLYHSYQDNNNHEQNVNDINKKDGNNLRNKEYRGKNNIYIKILIIFGLVVIMIFVMIYSYKKLIFAKKINSKIIEDYKDFDKKENKYDYILDDKQIN